MHTARLFCASLHVRLTSAFVNLTCVPPVSRTWILRIPVVTNHGFCFCPPGFGLPVPVAAWWFPALSQQCFFGFYLWLPLNRDSIVFCFVMWAGETSPAPHHLYISLFLLQAALKFSANCICLFAVLQLGINPFQLVIDMLWIKVIEEIFT